MGPEAKEIYSDAHILSRGGVKPPEALRIARENAAIPQELKDQRAKDYKALKPYDENPGVLKDFMKNDDSRFGFEDWVGVKAPAIDQMTAEFSNMVEVHYERTGDVARAQAMAYDTIKETWSPTSIGTWVTGTEPELNPTRAMKYSPERMMNVSSEMANNRLAAFAQAFDLNVENMTVHQDPITARDGSWRIVMIDPETGFPESVPTDPETGQILRWRGNDWAEAGAQYAWDKQVEAAIKEREKRERTAQGLKGRSQDNKLGPTQLKIPGKPNG